MISQYNDGFVSYTDGVLAVMDNDLNVTDEYLFKGEIVGLTFDGLVVSITGKIFDLQTGENIKGQKAFSVSEYSDYVSRDGLILVNYRWEDNLSVFCQNSHVNFFYGRFFKTPLENNFKHYIYKNSKSILIYDDYVEFYEGELYPVTRIKDLLEDEGLDDADYASLVAIYNIQYTSLKIFPRHLMIGDNILDLDSHECYAVSGITSILGVVKDYIITLNNKIFYKYLSAKIKNVM